MAKKIFFSASLAAGVAIFAYVIAGLGGIDPTLETIGRLGSLGLTVYVLNTTMVLVIPALSWTILMRGEGLKASYWTALKANLMGWPLNYVTPTLFLGGEPLKTIYVAGVLGERKRRVLATIVVAKFQEFGALLLVMVVAVAIAVWKLDLTPRQEAYLIGSMAIISIVFGLTMYAFIRNFKPTVRFLGFLARMGVAPRHMLRLKQRAEEMEQIIHASFTKRWKTFVAAQGVVLFSSISILIRAWIFFAFMSKLLGIEDLCLIYVITNVANALPVPGGLGVFEGGMDFFSRLEDAELAGYLVANRAGDLVVILVGLYLIVHLGLQSLARRVAKGEVKGEMEEQEEQEEQSSEPEAGSSEPEAGSPKPENSQ